MSPSPAPRSLLGLPRVYWILWVGQFINRLGGFVLTFLPLFLTEHHHYRDSEAGAVLSLYGLGNLFGSSLGGWASDRFGRRRTMLVALVASASVLLAFGFAPPGALMAMAALAHGVSNGYGPALTAAVSDVVPPGDRARAFGYFYWAVNLGFMLAACMGGALSQRGYIWLFVGDALTTIAFAALVYALVPETRPPDRAGRERVRLSSLPRALFDPRFIGFAVAQALVLVVFLQTFVTLPLQERAAGVPLGQVGFIAALNGAVIVLVQPLFLRLSRGQASWRLLTLAALLIGVGAFQAAHARSVRDFALCMIIMSVGEVAFSGAAPTFTAHVAPSDRRGTYQGAYSLCWAGAALIGPLVGPAVRASRGAPTLWHTGALLCALAALIHALATRRAERLSAGVLPLSSVRSP